MSFFWKRCEPIALACYLVSSDNWWEEESGTDDNFNSWGTFYSGDDEWSVTFMQPV